MYAFGGIIIAALVAGYSASLLSRLRRRKGRALSWLAVLIAGTFVGVLAALAATFQGDLFRPSHWSSKDDSLTMFLIVAMPSTFIALGSAFAVILMGIYRDKPGDSKRSP